MIIMSDSELGKAFEKLRVEIGKGPFTEDTKEDLVSEVNSIARKIIAIPLDIQFMSERETFEHAVKTRFAPLFKQHPRLFRLPLYVFGRYGNSELKGEVMDGIYYGDSGYKFKGLVEGDDNYRFFAEEIEGNWEEIEKIESLVWNEDEDEMVPKELDFPMDGDELIKLYDDDSFYGTLIYLQRSMGDMPILSRMGADHTV